MRPIKFRVWDTRHNKYLYANSPFDWSYFDDDGSVYLYDIFTNERFVLEQFTGLKDGNGVEIYEGDILKDEYAKTYDSVVWRDGGFFFDYWGAMAYEIADKDILEEIVIGNIFQNPELLNMVSIEEQQNN